MGKVIDVLCTIIGCIYWLVILPIFELVVNLIWNVVLISLCITRKWNVKNEVLKRGEKYISNIMQTIQDIKQD